MELSIIIFVSLIVIILVLCACILYLVFSYRKLLEKYHDEKIREEGAEFRQHVRLQGEAYKDRVVHEVLNKSIKDSVKLISQKADKLTKDIRREAIEELVAKQAGEDQAISVEYDKVKKEIENYKAQKLTEIDTKVKENIVRITKEILPEILTNTDHEELIKKAIENAKRSNLF